MVMRFAKLRLVSVCYELVRSAVEYEFRHVPALLCKKLFDVAWIMRLCPAC